VLLGAELEVVKVSGLLPGHVYHLTERIQTAGGLTTDRTLVLRAEHL
jgi:hypothetical protein